jgi:hypothetical protein
VPELPLDDDQRHTFTGHLHCVRVSELMRREAATDPGFAGGVAQLRPNPGGRARPAACWSAKHTEDRADGERGSDHEPRRKLVPCAAISTVGGSGG